MLEKGSRERPTGNLIIYCYVIGENPFQSGSEVIASNVVVSFLKINDNFPVVTFPPISFVNMDELKKILINNEDLYDLARLPDFRMPEDKEMGNQYIQNRMEQYNHFVMKYVELCKNREKTPAPSLKLHGADDYIDVLRKLSTEFRTSTGILKDTTQMKIENLISEFSPKFPQFDLINYQKALFFPGQKGEVLIRLYIQKYEAIQNEKYETASLLKKQINELEYNE
jgi:hypothetical protein